MPSTPTIPRAASAAAPGPSAVGGHDPSGRKKKTDADVAVVEQDTVFQTAPRCASMPSLAKASDSSGACAAWPHHQSRRAHRRPQADRGNVIRGEKLTEGLIQLRGCLRNS